MNKITCYVVGIKKSGNKIEGFFINPSNFKNNPDMTIYQEAFHLYNRSNVSAYEYVVRYKNRDIPLKLEKFGDEYRIIVPDNEEEKKAIENISQTDVHSSDYI